MCNHLSFLSIVDRSFDPLRTGALESSGGSVGGLFPEHEYCVNSCVLPADSVRSRQMRGVDRIRQYMQTRNLLY